MTIELPAGVENELRDLADQQQRTVETLVEEAIRQYLQAVAITDLTPGEVAETQMALSKELSSIPSWEDP